MPSLRLRALARTSTGTYGGRCVHCRVCALRTNFFPANRSRERVLAGLWRTVAFVNSGVDAFPSVRSTPTDKLAECPSQTTRPQCNSLPTHATRLPEPKTTDKRAPFLTSEKLARLDPRRPPSTNRSGVGRTIQTADETDRRLTVPKRLPRWSRSGARPIAIDQGMRDPRGPTIGASLRQGRRANYRANP